MYLIHTQKSRERMDIQLSHYQQAVLSVLFLCISLSFSLPWRRRITIATTPATTNYKDTTVFFFLFADFKFSRLRITSKTHNCLPRKRSQKSLVSQVPFILFFFLIHPSINPCIVPHVLVFLLFFFL
mmetsp:Transcript_13759/g.20845  ORF Transcript_13759/g.20845 Transcript_13759/m.20845 type:complete len:127 (+) Transcript_13759:31-411(+)